MLKIAYSRLFNAPIARTATWIRISSWKLYFLSVVATWLSSRRSRHGALAGRRIVGASFGTLTGRRRGRLVGGVGTIHPCCWRRGCQCWCQRRGLWHLRSLVQPISFADAPSTGLVGTKPRCASHAHDAAIEVAQHFGKIVVKSVFGNVWFRHD